MDDEHTSLRVALISDTHAYLDPRVEAEVSRCDYVVHAGDVGGATVLKALKPRHGVVLAVRGNNDTPDKWPAEEALILKTLPLSATLELPGGRLVVDHGDKSGSAAARHETLRARYPEARVVVYGHSHHHACDQSAVPWVLNPGAAGKTRTRGGPSMMILTASTDEWQLETVRFDAEK